MLTTHWAPEAPIPRSRRMSGRAMTAVSTLRTSTNCETHSTPRPTAPSTPAGRGLERADWARAVATFGSYPPAGAKSRASNGGTSTMPPARKPAKSRSKKVRARRSPVPWPPRLPVFEQRHLDLIGLGLVAVGVFLAFPLYAGWEGGEAGQAVV